MNIEDIKKPHELCAYFNECIQDDSYIYNPKDAVNWLNKHNYPATIYAAVDEESGSIYHKVVIYESLKHNSYRVFDPTFGKDGIIRFDSKDDPLTYSKILSAMSNHDESVLFRTNMYELKDLKKESSIEEKGKQLIKK